MIGKSYAKIAIVGSVLCLAMVLCASFARYRSEQSFIDGAENGFGIDGMYVNDGATRPSMAILAGEDMEWQICNGDGSCLSGRLAATSARIRSIFSTMMERIAVLFTFHMHREMGWTASSSSPTRPAISRCAGLTGCRLLSRSESSRRPADQAAGVSNPEFIRTHTDEFEKQPWYSYRNRIREVVVLDTWDPESGRYLFDGLTQSTYRNSIHRIARPWRACSGDAQASRSFLISTVLTPRTSRTRPTCSSTA